MVFLKNCLTSVVEDASEVELALSTKVGRQVAQTFKLHTNSGKANLNFSKTRTNALKLITETVLSCHFLIKSIKLIWE